jgi:DNA-binding winged helix-turn-helix (wHTH) protein/tetratricopeptide (TPR) repeat protein
MDRPPKSIYEFGRFRVDPGARLLTRDGQPLPLPTKAFDLLLILIRNSGSVVPKNDLMQALWPDTFVQDQNLKQNIFLIRKALGEKAHQCAYVASAHGKGYRFLPRVIERHEGLGETPPGGVRSSISGTAIKRPRQFVFPTILIVLLAALAAYTFSFRKSPRRPTRLDVSINQNEIAPQPRSVVILDVRNLSGRRDDDWLSTAIPEMLSTELGAGEQLRVVSGEEVARFKLGFRQNVAGTLSRETLARIRGTLAADLLVSGAYTLLGSRNDRVVRIDLRVQDAVSGDTIAEISNTGREDDLFALLSEAGARLRGKLAIRELTPAEFASVKASLPTNAEAAKLYSEALARLRAFEPLPARDLFEHVATMDPTNSRVHSALSETWEMLGYQERFQDEARKAFELAAALPDADRFWAEARLYESAKEWEKAIKVYSKLFLSYPENVDHGLRLARAEISAGKANEALKVIESLRRLPPPAREDPRIDLTEAAAAQSLFDVPKAKAAADRAAVKGTALGARLIVAQAKYSQAEADSDLQNAREALAEYEQARELYAAVGDRSGLCHALIGVGNIVQGQDHALARAIFSRVLEMAREIGDQRNVARALLDLANVSYDDGELQKAKSIYEKAVAVYREINDRPGTAGVLLNIGLTLGELGDYQSAEVNLQRSLAIATELNLRFDITDAYNTLGTVFYHEGKLSESLQAYNNSLSAARAIEFKDGIIENLADIGRIMQAQGELGMAREKEKEALALQEDSLGSRLELARIELEDHNPAAAEVSARKALTKANNKTTDNLTCYTVLAQALLAQGKPVAADKILKHAEALGMKKSAFLDARLEFAVTSARVQAALGRGTQASTMLQATIADARAVGDVPYQLEACNALVAIDVQRATSLDTRPCVNALQQHAASLSRPR